VAFRSLPAAGTIAWGIALYYRFGNLGALGGLTGISGIPPLQFVDLELRSRGEFLYLIWDVLLLLTLITGDLLDSRVIQSYLVRDRCVTENPFIPTAARDWTDFRAMKN